MPVGATVPGSRAQYERSMMLETSIQVEQIRKALGEHPPRTVSKVGLIAAAVLIPLVQRREGLEVLLTVRTDNVEHHKGQIAFPGGAREPGDHDVFDTALREAMEEIALPRAGVELIGRIDDLATPTGFVVSPVVGYISDLPVLELQPEEVSAYFTVPLPFFLEGENGYTREYERDGESRQVWFYDYEHYTIWGITAAIIRNFKQVLEAGAA